MKQVLFILFLTSCISVYAKKLVYPLEVVAGSADLIVIGEIEDVRANTYTFKIVETLKGQIHETITVKKFKEWKCDVRFANHEVGQKLCLFLKKGVAGWEIINGSTGEKPLDKDKYEFIYVYNGFKPNIIGFNEFKTAIVEFCKCFEIIGEYEPFEKKPRFKRLCTEDSVLVFKTINTLTEWLYERVSKYEIITKK